MNLGGEPAKHVSAVHVDHRQFPCGHAQDRARPERAERELDAGLGAVVGDQRRRGVQSPGQGDVLRGRLSGVGMLGDGERLVQREDQRQIRRRQTPMLGRRDPACR